MSEPKGNITIYPENITYNLELDDLLYNPGRFDLTKKESQFIEERDYEKISVEKRLDFIFSMPKGRVSMQCYFYNNVVNILHLASEPENISLDRMILEFLKNKFKFHLSFI